MVESAKQSEAIAKAGRETASLESALKDMSDELLALIELKAEKKKLVESLSAELNEANIALRASDEEVARLNLEYTAKQSELKKLHDHMHEIKSKSAQELKTLMEKKSALENEAASIIESLKNWRSL